jgi:hypothetical protein
MSADDGERLPHRVRPSADEREAALSARERAADDRDAAADARDAAADARDLTADERDAAANRRGTGTGPTDADVQLLLDRALERDAEAERRDRHAEARERAEPSDPETDAADATRRGQTEVDRLHAGRDRDAAASDLADLLARRRAAAQEPDAD